MVTEVSAASGGFMEVPVFFLLLFFAVLDIGFFLCVHSPFVVPPALVIASLRATVASRWLRAETLTPKLKGHLRPTDFYRDSGSVSFSRLPFLSVCFAAGRIDETGILQSWTSAGHCPFVYFPI